MILGVKSIGLPVLFGAFSVFAESGWVSVSSPEIALFDASSVFPEGSRSRIRELAKGLDFNWMKCFRFVRDNVRFVPSPGLLRGAERTLIDREGSDADQAVLLKALLAACGVTGLTRGCRSWGAREWGWRRRRFYNLVLQQNSGWPNKRTEGF